MLKPQNTFVSSKIPNINGTILTFYKKILLFYLHYLKEKIELVTKPYIGIRVVEIMQNTLKHWDKGKISV